MTTDSIKRYIPGTNPLAPLPYTAGGGTEPAQPAQDLLADRALLRRAVQLLEDDGAAPHARALRTLLERLDGAP